MWRPRRRILSYTGSNDIVYVDLALRSKLQTATRARRPSRATKGVGLVETTDPSSARERLLYGVESPSPMVQPVTSCGVYNRTYVVLWLLGLTVSNGHVATVFALYS